MASLRTGTGPTDCTSCITNNFRPPCPLGSRKVSLFTDEPDRDTLKPQGLSSVSEVLVREGKIVIVT